MGAIFQSVGILFGVTLVCMSLFEFKKHGESGSHMSQQQGSLFGPLATLIAGVSFLVLPTVIHTLLHSFWGYYSPFHWDHTVDPTGNMRGPYNVLITFVRLVGVGAMMRGIFLLSKLGKQGGQPGNGGKAMITIVAAILCINIVGTYQLFCTILGITT